MLTFLIMRCCNFYIMLQHLGEENKRREKEGEGQRTRETRGTGDVRRKTGDGKLKMVDGRKEPGEGWFRREKEGKER